MRCYALTDEKLIEMQPDNFKLFRKPFSFVVARPDELSAIADIAKIHPYTLHECENANHHARLDVHPNYSFGIFSAAEIKDSAVVPLDFAFYLTETSLLLVSNDGNSLLAGFIDRMTQDGFTQQYAQLSPQLLLLALLGDVIENNDNDIEEIERDLEKLEENILDEVLRVHSKQISAAKRLIMQLKHHVEPLVFMIESMNNNENGLFGKTQLKSLQILVYKANRMLDNTILLRDYATQVREAFEAEQDINSNEVMKIFTVVTSIFLPLSLLVGWYGMNFKNMPELTWPYGYPAVIGLSIAVIGVMLMYFKKKRWF